jgi:hypothetical protein
MEWQSVEATCDCPHMLESARIWARKSEVDSIGEAKEAVEKGVEEHLSESQHCSRDTVEKTVHWEDSW